MTLNGHSQRYELYGLPGRNPYAPRVLDPIVRAQDRDLRLSLGGYCQVEPIYTYLREAIAAERPAFVVISGRDFTGRTSMANCVLDLYRELRDVGDRFLVSRVEVTHHRDFEWFQQMMAQLQNEFEMAELSLSDPLVGAFDRIGNIPESIYPQKFQAAARMLGSELSRQKSPYAFGALFEGLHTASLINRAQTIFRHTSSLVVFTHRDYEHAQTPSADLLRADMFSEEIHLVRLLPLVESQIQLLAHHRWEQASKPESPCPFDLDGIAEIFRNAPVPIKAALTRLAKLLDYKLSLASGETPWPDNQELAMSRQWLVETVSAMDGWPR
ncbi:hypothetical protein [Sphaerisporangium dianthi]|uniref:ATP-binding protein n=1 Tax=Sphaerisporangium dianthi TaxID=1436120 RepID=A0ABV9CBA2_9ACTN